MNWRRRCCAFTTTSSTRAQPSNAGLFVRAAKYENLETGAAMTAFAADPTSAQAIATLKANPATVGKIGTTCVVTMISGGNALNALPQLAEANVNCRLFPGHSRYAIMAKLQNVANDPAVTFQKVTEASATTPASPMRPDFTVAVKTATASVCPDVPMFPNIASCASDNMWFPYHGLPSYGASPVLIKESEAFSHVWNERTPVATIAPAIDYDLALVPLLTK